MISGHQSLNLDSVSPYSSQEVRLLSTDKAVYSINDLLIDRILSSWMDGNGALPARMGLEARRFQALVERHGPSQTIDHLPSAEARRPLDTDRFQEAQEVSGLLRGFANPHLPTWETETVADLIAAGCQGESHLYRDLGLAERSLLSKLIAHNFPRFHAKNLFGMKWKKFIYRQLCEREGITLCRSPSCAVCPDYSHCFSGSE